MNRKNLALILSCLLALLLTLNLTSCFKSNSAPVELSEQSQDASSRNLDTTNNNGNVNEWLIPLLSEYLVEDVQNQPPTITSYGGTTSTSDSIPENTTFVEDLAATDDSDSEGSGLNWSISGGVDGRAFSINTTTGDLSFKNPPDFENPQDQNNDNNYIVEVTVIDQGGLEDEVEIAVTVTDVSNIPMITSYGGTTPTSDSIDENTTFVEDLEAIDDPDSEGSGLEWSITGGADAALFEIDKTTGALSFKNPPDFENPQDANVVNKYIVEVTVTDSDLQTDTSTIAVTVDNINEAPEISSYGGASSGTNSIIENTTLVEDLNATDVDSTGLVWSISVQIV